jgi:hypothetical protein
MAKTDSNNFGDWKKLNPPPSVRELLAAAPPVIVPATLVELMDLAVG